MSFTHLHLHTEYSMLDGANKIKELAKRLKELDFKSCAITDHGNMFGAIDFYKTMKKEGIKPIIGMEAYLHAEDDIGDTNTRQRWHLCLFAKNQKGYENLMYLSSMSYLKGFYYYPRINKKILKEYSEGLVCSSACLGGEINWHLNYQGIRNNGKTNADYGARGYEAAKEAAKWYKDVFGDDFYLEIMRMGIKDQLNIDNDIIKIGKELNIKIIATNDAHYLNKDKAQALNVLMAINTGDIIGIDPEKDDNQKSSLRHTMSEIYVKSQDEMRELFLDIPEAVSNTQEIVDKCNLDLKLGNPTPPNFKFAIEYAKDINLSLPSDEIFSFENDDVLFEKLCFDGLKKRLKYIDESKHEEYKTRLETEINIIKNMKFSGYMLIVHDFIKAAKDKGIPVGPGRGSAAGSLVSFCLEITDLDPLPYNLLFERFLNPERISMPDIDVDFCQDRRAEVIEYVVNKYGRYNVAQVITFGKLLAKGVIRDVSRVCDIRLKDADTLAKLIPDDAKSLSDAYDKNPDIKTFIEQLDNNADYKNIVCHPDDIRGYSKMGSRIWEYSLALEGLNRNAGMHAAGVVISNEELWKKTPLFKQPKKEHLVTQYFKDYLEDVDLIKFDFLGLTTLTVIDNAIKLIKKRHGIDINWNTIDVNDKGVYELIQTGHTLGIFQIESSGMQDLNARLKPTCFEDLIAVLALYRPGPLDSGMVDDFIDIKHERKEAIYAFPELRPILEPTYGVIVYQEQVMQVVQTIGGFSLGGADLVRRAMGKKKLEEMVKLKGQYLEGAKKQGFDEKKADDLWELILKFAEYGFNKSHSAAYALIAFQTAYLKRYYQAEFMAALLTSVEGEVEKIEKYKDELDRLGIELIAPSINESTREFNVIEKDGKTAIVYGLSSIKSFGIPSAYALVEARANKPFSDINDFITRAKPTYMNKKDLESLAKTDCFACIGLNRKSVLESIEFILNEYKSRVDYEKKIEGSLFADFTNAYASTFAVPLLDELPNYILAALDKEYLGVFLGTHPLDTYKHIIKKINHYKSSDIEFLEDGNYNIFCLATIDDVEFKQSKNGRYYANVKALDYYSNFNALCFNDEVIKKLESKFKAMNQDSSEKTSSLKEFELFGLCLSVKKESGSHTLFVNDLIEIKEEDLGTNNGNINSLGIEVFVQKGSKKLNTNQINHILEKINYLNFNDLEGMQNGDYDALVVATVEKVEFRVSKKGRAFASIFASSVGADVKIMCFNDEIIERLKLDFEDKIACDNTYAFRVNIKIDDENTYFLDEYYLLDEANIPKLQDFKALEKRVAKKRKDFTSHPKAFECEYINIDLLATNIKTLEEISNLVKDNINIHSSKEIVLNFYESSCVYWYTQKFRVEPKAIEKIKELAKIS